MSKNILDLYDEHFVARDFERLDLFEQLAQCYGVSSSLYPGSWVHVAPSFVFPVTCYVDNDRRAKRFFAEQGLHDWIAARKQYESEAVVVFYGQDYMQPLDEPDQRYDLLISQYAGFVSQPCKRYLKLGGLLLASNSHGDAGLAHLDPDYRLIAVVQRRSGRHRITEQNLSSYFLPKRPIEVTQEYLLGLGKGLAYTKSASGYLFERVS